MKRLVVVGNGMAAVACLEQILQRDHDFEITIFGDETHANYNRVVLPAVLAGDKSPDEIALKDRNWYQDTGILTRLGVRVVRLDPAERLVIDEDGGATRFDRLILATGSRALVPPIAGLEQENVHTLRTLDDTRALLQKLRPGLKTVVLGGGLLGLEAARGLQVRGCKATVVERADRLMQRQLDIAGSLYLKRKIEGLGIRVLLDKKTEELLGPGIVEGLRFDAGDVLEAEAVVIAAGIRPDAELARQAGLEVCQGVVVNDYMETSDPDIFAVGGCTEHRGVTFGLGEALLEQGMVLAATITGNRGPVFTGAAPVNRLNIPGLDAFSAGNIDESEAGVELLRYEDPSQGVYKKLLLRGNRLLGVILVGDASDQDRYLDWLCRAADLTALREHLLFPPPMDAAPGMNLTPATVRS
jgi:nitrite reductase (NADH) large subunit